MQTYDIIMLIVLALATLTGFIKGLVWQVASLTSLFASYLVAIKYGDRLAGWLPVSKPWSVVLAMLLLFLITSAAIWFLCQLIRDWLDRMKLQGFDRQIGALLGLAKGLLFCTLITAIAVTLFGPTVRTHVARSQTGRLVGRLLDRSERLLPAELSEVLEPFLKAVDRQLQQGEAADVGRRPNGRRVAMGAGCPRSGTTGFQVTSRDVWPLPSGGGRGTSGRSTGTEKGVFRGENGYPTEHKKHYRTLGRGKKKPWKPGFQGLSSR